MWKAWINGIAGLAVIAVAFLGLAGATLTWTLVVLGVIVAVLGFWSALGDTAVSSEMRTAFR